MVLAEPPVAAEKVEPVTAEDRKTGKAILPVVPVEGVPLRRFTLDEYHHLIDIGFFEEKERVELLEGMMLYMSPINPLHSFTVDLLAEIFGAVVTRGKTRVRTQGPISLADTDSEPEPDLIIYRVPEGDFSRRHPFASEILVVMEVSETSLAYDRTSKGAVYARAGVAEYWIWNLVDGQLEVYRDPHSPAAGDAVYQTKLTLHRGDSLSPQAFPDFHVAVDDVLPPAADAD